MTTALAEALTCTGCDGPVSRYEEGRCAHCRMLDRGDGQLLAHDSRGWVARGEHVQHRRKGGVYGEPAQFWTEEVIVREPCECGCGMESVPEAEAYPPVSQVKPVVPFKDERAERWPREAIIEAIRAWADRYGKPPRVASWQKGNDEHPGQGRVIAVFGSWNAAIEAAGLTPHTANNWRGRRGG